MGVTEHLDDIRLAITRLSDENKKYVIAVAQALLFTQKKEKDGQDRLQDMACSIQK